LEATGRVCLYASYCTHLPTIVNVVVKINLYCNSWAPVELKVVSSALRRVEEAICHREDGELRRIFKRWTKKQRRGEKSACAGGAMGLEKEVSLARAGDI
jgi:predicted hydrocarbon binding protein